MDPIKVNDKTHNILVESNRVMREAQSNINVVLTALDVPQGWGYDVATRQFEPPAAKKE